MALVCGFIKNTTYPRYPVPPPLLLYFGTILSPLSKRCLITFGLKKKRLAASGKPKEKVVKKGIHMSQTKIFLPLIWIVGIAESIAVTSVINLFTTAILASSEKGFLQTQRKYNCAMTINRLQRCTQHT